MYKTRKYKYLYEERITIWQAVSLEQAMELAEEEGEDYASDGSDFLDYMQGYALTNPLAVTGEEIFSLLRESDLEPDQYLQAFFNTGAEHEAKKV